MKVTLIESARRLVAVLKRHAADLEELANRCTDGERGHYRRRAEEVRQEAAIEEAKLKNLT
jgi:hypothetical protein